MIRDILYQSRLFLLTNLVFWFFVFVLTSMQAELFAIFFTNLIFSSFRFLSLWLRWQVVLSSSGVCHTPVGFHN
jgi:hypothetical protein